MVDSIAVNVSTHQLGGGDLHELLSSILARHELESRWLEIEISESAIMQDDEGSAATLTKRQKDGLRVALDDFGTRWVRPPSRQVRSSIRNMGRLLAQSAGGQRLLSALGRAPKPSGG